MKKLFHSFKLRLFLLIILISIISSLCLGYGIVHNISNKIIDNKCLDMTAKMNLMSDYMKNCDYFQTDKQNEFSIMLDQLSSNYDGRVLVIDSNFTVIYDSFKTEEGKYLLSRAVIESFRKGTVLNVDKENRYIEISMPIGQLDTDKISGILYVSSSINDAYDIEQILNNNFKSMEILVIVIIIIMALLSAAILSRPFIRIINAIKEFAAFGENTTVISGYTETDEIAEAFTQLQEKLKLLDNSRQEFVSNVSHELKTPLTSMKVLADSLNEQQDVPIEIYQDFMHDIVDEIDRENSIITDLLSLVKLDKGAEALNIEYVNVNEILELIIKRLMPISKKNDVELIFDNLRDVDAEIDSVKMTLALTNLIENGIKYNKKYGQVRVSLDADHQFMIVTIEDTGIGIGKEDLNHIFERFYRVEKSHSKEINGTGLGLAIARKTILLHRGSIKVFSELNEGTTFIVRLPLSYVRV